MTGSITRILLRYISGALIARGLLGESEGNFIATDPDIAALVEIGIGAAVGAASEAWYALAKRYGWGT